LNSINRFKIENINRKRNIKREEERGAYLARPQQPKEQPSSQAEAILGAAHHQTTTYRFALRIVRRKTLSSSL
jgi:hypothetical protein